MEEVQESGLNISETPVVGLGERRVGGVGAGAELTALGEGEGEAVLAGAGEVGWVGCLERGMEERG